MTNTLNRQLDGTAAAGLATVCNNCSAVMPYNKAVDAGWIRGSEPFTYRCPNCQSKPTTKRPELDGLARKIAFPDALNFSDLFDEWTAEKEKQPTVPTMPAWDDSKDMVPFGPYVSIGGRGMPYRGLWAKCSEKVADHLRRNVVAGASDSIHFEAISHDNGYVLVVASNSQIIASYWLAYIKADSIPTA